MGITTSSNSSLEGKKGAYIRPSCLISGSRTDWVVDHV